MVDAQDTVMQAVPLYLLICISLITLVVFGIFRSLLLPLRLAFALLFTLAATFGTAVVFYQTPLLHGLFPWLANYDGLGLDYDIFLVSRIVEFRKEGFNDPTSIVLGVANTGGIISGAGAIMALAFSGLFFSPKLLHQQFAFLLVTSVLLDTFARAEAAEEELEELRSECKGQLTELERLYEDGESDSPVDGWHRSHIVS
eukprot:g29921.t1